ncbi:alpha/beta hydrolase [Hymenobacter siberiensis]|uniref:alpha/beta hydrolase n=1 Tax=Hymenobacter siberiensis TaxID=2848396 RepID=UPI001C1E1649|nr:alpha/beta fold hydrolase [Hymenobacter siberiensis]
MPAPTTAGSPTPLTIRLPDGRRLGLTRYGNPAHRAVVFHHGFGSSGLEVPDDAALLARLQLQILAPDRPGVGQSSVYRPLTFPSFADDVVAMLDALEIAGPVGVMGWSVGGVHALALAARHPARVAAAQLLSTCLPLGERAVYRHLSWVWKGLLWGQLGFPWLNRTTFLWLSRQWARHPDRTLAWFIRGMRPAEAHATVRHCAMPPCRVSPTRAGAYLMMPRPGAARPASASRTCGRPSGSGTARPMACGDPATFPTWPGGWAVRPCGCCPPRATCCTWKTGPQFWRKCGRCWRLPQRRRCSLRPQPAANGIFRGQRPFQ